MTALVNEDALRELVAAEVHAVTARPALVHQRNVEHVVGLPGREFLRLARDGAFASTKEKRLVLAKTEDVLAFFESRMRERPTAPVAGAVQRSRTVSRRCA